MTPQIATLLVALIALMIGAAFKLKRIQFALPIDLKGGKLNVFMSTWAAMGLIGMATAGTIALAHMGLHNLAQVLGASGLMLGTVTINWLWPATGATGPTAAQVANQDSVAVDITTDGTATTTTLTHNLNISPADIANGFPHIIIESNSASGIPATLLIIITRPVTANAVILTYAAVVGTFRVKILRPHSIGR
jgi:hypothetical protein